MKLYTICVRGRPVVTLSTDADQPVPDGLIEVDKALDTWLGAGLRKLRNEGQVLWTGDRNDLQIREAQADEAERWSASHRKALESGELDAGEESWLTFLVPVR